MVLGSVEGFAGADEDLPYLVPLAAPKVATKPISYTLKPSGSSSGGFFSSLTKGIGNVGNWFSSNSQGVVQVLDAAGRLKSGAKAQTTSINDAYYRNIVNTPPRSWFDDEMIPGLKNSALVVIAGGLAVGLFLMSRKSAAPPVQP